MHFTNKTLFFSLDCSPFILYISNDNAIVMVIFVVNKFLWLSHWFKDYCIFGKAEIMSNANVSKLMSHSIEGTLSFHNSNNCL